MESYTDAGRIAFSCCFILAVLTAAAYARWHHWRRTGFGRASMAMLAAFAGLTLGQAVRSWITLSYRSVLDYAVDVIRLSAAALASIALLYLLHSLVSPNIRRHREPGFAAEAGRSHLERTPWASDEEIGKLIAAWDEMHGNPRL